MSVGGYRITWVTKGGESGPNVLNKLTSAFERAGTDFKDFGRYFFPELIPSFEGALKKHFDVQGGGPSGKWAALSPGYAKWKRRHFPGKPILQRTGNLKDALTNSDSPMAAREYSASQLNFGTSGVHYADFHQLGTARMPARPEFDFTPHLAETAKGKARNVARDIMRGRLGDYATVAPPVPVAEP